MPGASRAQVDGDGAAPAAGAERPPPAHAPVTDLLRRMQAGERDAAAEFMESCADLLRRRYRRRLGPGMRRLFDSLELVSTVSRRLDQVVRSGALRATSEPQLWALIGQIAEHALTDKVRIYARLKRTEGEDSEFARELLARLSRSESNGDEGVEMELGEIAQRLEDPIDREVLGAWMRDQPHALTAEQLGMTEAGVKKRWQRIRQSLRATLSSNQ